MRISKFYIPEVSTKQLGLKEIDLTAHPLGSVVALVGRNGAGKSRILKFVEAFIQNMNPANITQNHFSFLPYEFIPKRVSGKDSTLGTRINDINLENFNKFKQKCLPYIKVIDNDSLKQIGEQIDSDPYINFEDILSNKHFESIVTEKIANSDKVNRHPQKKIINNEFDVFNSKSTLYYINNITDNIIDHEFDLYIENKKTPELIQEKLNKNDYYIKFQKFQKLIESFLGKEFSYIQSKNGRAVQSILMYNGRPFELKEFSPGQKTLFAYAILFFFLDLNKQSNIKDSILVIDEPEMNLHPESQLKLIDSLRSLIEEKGQLWIATHSVHILSHLNHDEIFLVKDDEIIKPSRLTPGHSLIELMGLDTHISELSDFINSTSEWAYANFMKQCFVAPESVFSDNLKDKQYVLFKEWISAKENIALLDYGAGKGRLGHLINLDPELKGRIQYSAFDTDPKAIDILKQHPNIVEVFENVEELNYGKYDTVVLCNVLHEIPLHEWEQVFHKIKFILKNDGKLIIIEDKFIPKGEKANDYGYLILGEKELSALFNIRLKGFLHFNGKSPENDRILFAEISRNLINVTSQSIRSAILALEKDSYEQLKELRKDTSGDARIGRLYANQCQLHINAKIALEKFK